MVTTFLLSSNMFLNWRLGPQRNMEEKREMMFPSCRRMVKENNICEKNLAVF